MSVLDVPGLEGRLKVQLFLDKLAPFQEIAHFQSRILSHLPLS